MKRVIPIALIKVGVIGRRKCVPRVDMDQYRYIIYKKEFLNLSPLTNSTNKPN